MKKLFDIALAYPLWVLYAVACFCFTLTAFIDGGITSALTTTGAEAMALLFVLWADKS